ncbi:MAG: transporter [Planctomycetota bacterium]|jgi:hypothetical protein
MTRVSLVLLLLAGLVAAEGFLQRPPKGEERPFVTDRPGNTDSPQTVPPGWFQVEADIVAFTEDSTAATRVRTLDIGKTNFGLKVGLTRKTDFHVIWAPYTREETLDRATGQTTTAEGVGNVQLRVKYNLWGNDGGPSALTLLPFVEFPAASSDFASSAGAGLSLPYQHDLGRQWTFNGELTGAYNDDRSPANVDEFTFNGSLKLGRGLSETWSAWAEVYWEIPTESDALATLDVGAVWGPQDNLAFDLTFFLGLNDAAPDFRVALGAAFRF